LKLLGISGGRKMGNSEVLLRESLMAAEDLGMEVEVLRLAEVDVKPCRMCSVCVAELRGPEACVIKDDAAFIWNSIMDSDGLIISAPVYCLTPPGYLLQIRDRGFGPKVDVGYMIGRKALVEQGVEVFVDDRCFKARPGAFISVGGSVKQHWVSYGLAIFQTMTFSFQLELVDQMQVISTGLIKGQVLLNEEAVVRANTLGRHVAEAMGKAPSEMKWMGEEIGTCPVCHQNQITINKRNPVECPICGIKGELTIEDGEIKVTFSEEERSKSRLTIAGKMDHWFEYHPVDPEMASALGETSNLPPSREKELRSQITEGLQKYKAHKRSMRPPARVVKKTTM
jgi:multimeric flavodoxin WrbA